MLLCARQPNVCTFVRVCVGRVWEERRGTCAAALKLFRLSPAMGWQLLQKIFPRFVPADNVLVHVVNKTTLTHTARTHTHTHAHTHAHTHTALTHFIGKCRHAVEACLCMWNTQLSPVLFLRSCAHKHTVIIWSSNSCVYLYTVIIYSPVLVLQMQMGMEIDLRWGQRSHMCSCKLLRCLSCL